MVNNKVGRPPVDPEIRFWSKVKKLDGLNACWEWCGTRSRGYGRFRVGGGRGTMQAHIFSHELAFGRIKGNLLVLHKCDNCCCVRPSHLFLGTQSDNIRDSVAKGRWPDRSGKRNPLWGRKTKGFGGRKHTKKSRALMSKNKSGPRNSNYKHGMYTKWK